MGVDANTQAILDALNRLGDKIEGGDAATPREDVRGEGIDPADYNQLMVDRIEAAQKLRDTYSEIKGVKEANNAINKAEQEALRLTTALLQQQLKDELAKGEAGQGRAEELSLELEVLKLKKGVLSEEASVLKEIEAHGQKNLKGFIKIGGHLKAMKKDTAGWMAMMGEKAADKALKPFTNKFKEVLMGLNEAEKGFERMTGLGEDFSHQIREGYEDLRGYGVTVGEMAEHQTALTQTMTDFTMTDAATRKSLVQTSAVLGELGVAANDLSMGYQVSTKMLGQTGIQAGATARELVAHAKDLGVAPGQLSAQFAQMGPQLAKFGEQGVKAFKDIAHISKITGMEMSKVLQLTNKFDTFEGAAEQAGKLNAALGGNFVNAMDLMMTTDPAERFSMIRDSILDAGLTFDDMSYYQKNFYKESLGLSDVGDLAMMLSGNMDDLTGDMGKTNDELIAMKENSQKVQSIQEQLQALLAQATPVFQVFADVISEVLGIFQKYPAAIKMIFPMLIAYKTAMFAAGIAQAFTALTGKKLTMNMKMLGLALLVIAGVLFVTQFMSNFVDGIFKLALGFAAAAISVRLMGRNSKKAVPAILSLGAAILMIGTGMFIAAKGAADLVLAFKDAGDAAAYAAIGLGLLMVPFLALMALAYVAIAGPQAAVTAGVLLFVLSLGAASMMLGIGMGLAAAGMALFVLGLSQLFKVMPIQTFMLFVATMMGLFLWLSLFAPLAPIAAAGLLLMGFGLMSVGAALLMMLPTMIVFNMLISGIGDLMDNTSGLKQVADDFIRIGNAIRTIPPVRTLALSTLMTTTAVASRVTGGASTAAGTGGGSRQVKVEISLDAKATKDFLNGNTRTFMGTESRDAAIQ